MILRLYSVGIPATLNLALPSILISALNGILASFSQVYILVLGIYYKLQTFLYLPANGFIQGMRPLVGFNYGAGEHRRVKQIYQIVLCMSGAIMAVGTVICLAVPGQLMGLFTQNPETIQAGETALLPLYCCYYSCGVYSEPYFRGCRCMERVLAGRTDYRGRSFCGIQESGGEEYRWIFPVIDLDISLQTAHNRKRCEWFVRRCL